MPLFDFQCDACGVSFETLVVRGEAPTCESCGSSDLRKLPSQLSLGKPKGKPRSSKNDGSSGDHIGNRAAAARAKGKTNSCC